MSIRKVVVGDVLEDIRRGDHIVFGINAEGYHPDDHDIYGLVREIREDYVPDLKGLGKNEIGTVITYESDDYNCFFHAIVTHSIATGWATDSDDVPHAYEAMQAALDQINEKYGDSIPLAAKTAFLGRGQQRKLGSTAGNVIHSLQSMANTELPLDLYVPDGWVIW